MTKKEMEQVIADLQSRLAFAEMRLAALEAPKTPCTPQWPYDTGTPPWYPPYYVTCGDVSVEVER